MEPKTSLALVDLLRGLFDAFEECDEKDVMTFDLNRMRQSLSVLLPAFGVYAWMRDDKGEKDFLFLDSAEEAEEALRGDLAEACGDAPGVPSDDGADVSMESITWRRLYPVEETLGASRSDAPEDASEAGTSPAEDGSRQEAGKTGGRPEEEAEPENGQKKKRVEDLCSLAYEAYKIDWMSRISADRQIDTLLDFWDNMLAGNDPFGGTVEWTFDSWVYEFGYDRELYVCMGEFLDEEFRDAEFMEELLRLGDKPELKERYEEAVEYIGDHEIKLRAI